jgi:hypothetical protein
VVRSRSLSMVMVNTHHLREEIVMEKEVSLQYVIDEQVSNFSRLAFGIFRQRSDLRPGNGPARWGQKGKWEERAKNCRVIEVYFKKPPPSRYGDVYVVSDI